MLPIKTILEGQPKTITPPILVIDETTIRCTHDAGPICQCEEKYAAIQNYKPFIPGGVNPYKKTHIPDGGECLETIWANIKVGYHDYAMEEPRAVAIKDLPKTYVRKEEEDLMFLRPPQYPLNYFEEKMKLCPQVHCCRIPEPNKS